jgi:hypothetical protein
MWTSMLYYKKKQSFKSSNLEEMSMNDALHTMYTRCMVVCITLLQVNHALLQYSVEDNQLATTLHTFISASVCKISSEIITRKLIKLVARNSQLLC